MSATVDSVTAQMANTNIQEPTTNATEADNNVNTSTVDQAASASAAEGRRLYIGNLAYATTEGELKDFFEGYLVESTSIPTNPRTSRPVGYAFVDLSTPNEAERAIAELNGKPILDRKVSVQLARKPEAAAEGGASGGEATSGNETRRRGSTRGRGRGRGRGARGGRGYRGSRGRGGNAAEGGAQQEGANGPTNVPAQVDPLTETTNEAATGEPGADAADGRKGGKQPRSPRERKHRGPPEDGIPSKTKIMVANLPYDLREETLLEIFQAYEPVSAKIALRPIPRFMVKKLQARNEPRKGRGFGFITLGSEEMQQKACSEMNGKDVEGREIAVKVAIDSPGKEDEDVNAPEGEAANENGVTEGAPAAETTAAA